jgi:tetratricopeptide (TPR) repeat protein
MEADTIIKCVEPSTEKAQRRLGREDMVKQFQKIVATVTIVVQENPHGQGNPWPTSAPALPVGNPGDPSSRSGSRRFVSAKPWFLSVFIILVAVAFSGYSWLDALARLRADDEGRTFVRRAIVNAPVSLPTPKVSQETLNTMASEAPPYQMAREQPKGASPNNATEQKKKAPQASPTPNPWPLKKTTLFSQALALHKDGRLQEAKKMYEAALERSPNLVSALNNLGTIHIGEKDYAQAHSVLEKATLADPSYADPYYNLACLNALQTNVEQGLFYLKKAIAADDTVRDRAKRDQDLENIRGHVEYERIIRHVEKP